MEMVEEEPDFPRAKAEEAGLPCIPNELSVKQRKELSKLLEEFKDVFAGKDFKFGNTNLIEHEIHTKGLPIRQPYRKQNLEVRKHEQEKLKEMLDQEIIRLSCSPWASHVVMVKKKEKKRRYLTLLCRTPIVPNRFRVPRVSAERRLSVTKNFLQKSQLA